MGNDTEEKSEDEGVGRDVHVEVDNGMDGEAADGTEDAKLDGEGGAGGKARLKDAFAKDLREKAKGSGDMGGEEERHQEGGRQCRTRR